MNARLSVIIPVLDESRFINTALDRLKMALSGMALEIIVVDGDAHGTTLKAIQPIDDDRIDLPVKIDTDFFSRTAKFDHVDKGMVAVDVEH